MKHYRVDPIQINTSFSQPRASEQSVNQKQYFPLLDASESKNSIFVELFCFRTPPPSQQPSTFCINYTHSGFIAISDELAVKPKPISICMSVYVCVSLEPFISYLNSYLHTHTRPLSAIFLLIMHSYHAPPCIYLTHPHTHTHTLIPICFKPLIEKEGKAKQQQFYYKIFLPLFLFVFHILEKIFSCRVSLLSYSYLRHNYGTLHSQFNEK